MLTFPMTNKCIIFLVLKRQAATALEHNDNYNYYDGGAHEGIDNDILELKNPFIQLLESFQNKQHIKCLGNTRLECFSI